MNRRSTSFGLLALAGMLACCTDAQAADRPNFLVILADDLGFSDLGCYGGEIETPRLDALAAGGLRFTQFYNTARCWPSRAAILTGYYAQQVRHDAVPGVVRRGPRPEWAPLVSEQLRPLGYRSYHSGKWHLHGKPLESGFDRSYEITGGQNNHFNSQGALDEGQQPPQSGNYYSTIGTADHAIRCLREHAEQFPDRPFFHYLCFIAPHFPLHALPEDIARYRQRYRQGWDAIQQQRYHRLTELGIANHPLPAMERDLGPPYDFPEALGILGPGEVNRPLPWNELTEVQREFQAAKMAVHAAMVDRIDREVGRVIDQLEAMGALDNTLILFASDNGASAEIMVRGDGHDPQASPGSAASYLCLGPGWSSSSNTPLRRHKVWVHEGGCSTPMIMHWPRGIAARGELRRYPAHLIDVAPTLLELAGGKPATPARSETAPAPPGRSLVSVLTRDEATRTEPLWWLHEGNRAIRVGDWKLVMARDEDWQLYDLSCDRGETNNLADQYPDKARQLAQQWQQMADQFFAHAASP